MTNHETDRRETVEYFVQCQQPDGTWEQASSTAADLDFAAERLAAKRRMLPEFVYRIAQRTTVVVVGPVDAAAVSVPPPATRADDQAALRDRIAEALYAHDHPGWRVPLAESDVEPVYQERAASVLAVLPEPADAPAAECSAQHRRFDDGRLCIRAAQHHGDHIDERGFHWSDTVAVYPLGDGTFRRGTDVRATLRRLAAVPGPCVAGEQQNETPEARPLLCPRCGDDISEYGEDDFVFRTGDERPYCSGECIVAAHRAALSTPPAVVAQPGKEPAAGVRQDGATS